MKVKTTLTKTLALIVALLIMSASFGVYAEETNKDTVITLQIDNPIMTVNGVDEEIDPGRGTSPLIVNGRTLVPIRAIIEALGGTVGWDGEKSEVTLTYKSDVIKLVIDSYSAYLNDIASTLDVAPAIINERTMLPIRYISESFKFNVDWNGETQIVTITKPVAEEKNTIIVVGTSDSHTSSTENSVDSEFDEESEVLENMEEIAREEEHDAAGGVFEEENEEDELLEDEDLEDEELELE